MSNHANRSPKTRNITRRRAIRIMGAAAGMAFLPRASAAQTAPLWRRWDGEVMGAVSSIELMGPDAKRASELVAACLAEARRLETLFSLHADNSAIRRLNAQGYLDRPDRDFIQLLRLSGKIHRQTRGAFDITVQPLWRLYADHFTIGGNGREETDPAGPDKTILAETLKLVDQTALGVTPERIEFANPGMQITLNGIAQGYITDRIADFLHRNGIENVLIDMGETRALGRNAAGAPWKIGLLDPERPFELAGSVELENRAIATSGSYGLEFDRSGRYHHILDPKTGMSTARNLAVTVTAPGAAMADGLSTAFSAMEKVDISQVVASYAGVGALITDKGGAQTKIGDLPQMLSS